MKNLIIILLLWLFVITFVFCLGQHYELVNSKKHNNQKDSIICERDSSLLEWEHIRDSLDNVYLDVLLDLDYCISSKNKLTNVGN